MACPWCGHPAPDGARFCSSCGRALTAAAPEERRVVTVLFADLVGFTTLAEGQDPERVKRWIDEAFERLVADVERFGGRVDKVLGDAVIALFGAPVAHEDDAERAVRAAVCMHESLAAFVAERVARGSSVAPLLRIGINTGEVVVGSVAGGEYTAMGDVVNVAARLQSLASPGGTLVGDATRTLCSDAVVFSAREPAVLRGRETPEQVWEVASVEMVGRARRARIDTPFVGRLHERSLLASIGAMVTHGRGGVVHVVGEAGIGKSRLVERFLERWCSVRPDLVVVRGSCPPYGSSDPWSPIATGIAAHYGLEPGADAATVRDRVRDRAAAEHDDVVHRIVDSERSPDPYAADPDERERDLARAVEREVEAVAHLLGHPSTVDRHDPAGARDLLFTVVIDLVRRSSRRAPVVLWIDDLHWAPAVLSDLLVVLARSVHDVPVLVVTASRPYDDPERRDPAERREPNDRGIVVHLPLVPLEPEESAELVRAIAGADVDPDEVTRLTERSGGNPLFLTELVHMARTSESSGPDAPELPGTLRALVAARLDELPSTARAVLENAAILGTAGPVAWLAEFATAMDQPWDPEVLEVLDASGLLEVDDEGSWRFRSEVVRDVAYGTLTKRSRAQRHAGVATVMGGYGDVMLDEVAHHAASAAELVADLGPTPGVAPGIDTWAVAASTRSARRAIDLGAFRRGVEVAERGLALVADDDAAGRRALLVLRAEGLVELRRTDQARLDLQQVLDGATAEDDRVQMGEASRLLGAVEQLDGDLDAARDHLGRAVEVFRDLDDRVRLARALRGRGYAEVFGGSLQEAEWFLGEADACYEELGDERGRAWVAQHRAWIAFLSGDHEHAEEQLRAAAATFARLGDRSGHTWTRGLLAFVLYFQRRADEADELASEVAVEARRWGDDWGASMMLTLTADLRLWDGRFESALERGERALDGFRRMGDRFGIFQALTPVNRARVALGRLEDAERGIEEIRAVAMAFGGLSYPSVAASGVAMHLGLADRTVELADEAARRMEDNGSTIDEAYVQWAVGELMRGRPDDAMAAIDRVLVADAPFVRAVRALVLAALGDHDAARTEVAAVTPAVGASYFDATLAAVAAAAVAAPDRDERLEVAMNTGDVVMAGVARAARRRLDGADAAASPPAHGAWAVLLDTVFGGGAS